MQIHQHILICYESVYGNKQKTGDTFKEDSFKERDAMISILQKLINRSIWNAELCSTAHAEVRDERYRY